MAVGGVMVFERRPKLTRAMVLERVGQRLHLIPRLRQRLEEPPLGIASPVWTDDVNFDLDWHIRQASLPKPGGDAELGQFVGREFSHRLDRSRPLWEITLIEGLKGGRTALLLKAHHALVDGMAALALGALLLDPSPEPLEIAPPEQEWAPLPYDMRKHVTKLATTPLTRAARPVFEGLMRALDPNPRRAVTDAIKAAQELRKATDVALELAKNRPTAPMLAINRTISSNRRYTIATADLATVKKVGKLAGGTINDTILAIVTGMLARYIEAAEGTELPGEARMTPLKREPIALVPVSVRSENESGELGNRISTIFVDLPIEESDLLARIARIHAEMSEIKDSAAIRAGEIMVGMTGLAPPLVSGLMVMAMGQMRAFNMVVSNMPGPQQPLYMTGVRATEIYPLAPLNPSNQGLNVGVISYDGTVCFGILADRDLEPGLSVATDGLHAALAELEAAAR
jgi:WS/DGAT/MGAT family acyltransferase